MGNKGSEYPIIHYERHRGGIFIPCGRGEANMARSLNRNLQIGTCDKSVIHKYQIPNTKYRISNIKYPVFDTFQLLKKQRYKKQQLKYTKNDYWGVPAYFL